MNTRVALSVAIACLAAMATLLKKQNPKNRMEFVRNNTSGRTLAQNADEELTYPLLLLDQHGAQVDVRLRWLFCFDYLR
jgi:hypothetical protein